MSIPKALGSIQDLGTVGSSSQPFRAPWRQDYSWVHPHEQPVIKYGEESTSGWWPRGQNLPDLDIPEFEHTGNVLVFGYTVDALDKESNSDWLSLNRHVRVSETPHLVWSQLSGVLPRILSSYWKERKKLDFPTQLQWELLGEYATCIAKNPRVQLANALRDLSNVAEEAKEEGYLIPSEITVSSANQLLRKMYDILPLRYEVYPMPDGEVTIDAPTGHGSSVMVVCDSGGGALCLVNIKGESRRARYSTTKMLPDGFICEALKELNKLT